jgi:hypothetical protein
MDRSGEPLVMSGIIDQNHTSNESSVVEDLLDLQIETSQQSKTAKSKRMRSEIEEFEG